MDKEFKIGEGCTVEFNGIITQIELYNNKARYTIRADNGDIAWVYENSIFPLQMEEIKENA